MLYARWLQVAHSAAKEVALLDSPSGQRWTFQQLQRLGEDHTVAGPLACPQGSGPEFVFTVLAGWRQGAVLCPLEEGQAPPAISCPAECVHLKSTSASTGTARWIAFTAEQLQADVDQIVAAMDLRPEQPNLAVISLAHSYGFSNLILPLLLHGIPLILAGSALPEAVRRAASLAPRVALPAVPALWRAWLNTGAIPAGVETAISAGAPLPLELEKDAFERRGLKIHNFYGASECGGIAFDAASLPRSDPSCAGRPMPGVTLSLNEEGCLRVQSRAAGLSYWPDPSPQLASSCFQTSDLGELRDGLVYLHGRQSDQINVAGRKVSPERIERALATHPGVRECLVFGVPSPMTDRAEIIVACVATRRPLSQKGLRQHLSKALPAWQIPREWWFVAEMEANARGKLARAVWRQKYLNERPQAGPHSPS